MLKNLCVNDKMEAVKWLIDHSVDVNKYINGHYGYSALLSIIVYDMAFFEITTIASIETQKKIVTPVTPSHMSLERKKEYIDLLIDNDATIDDYFVFQFQTASYDFAIKLRNRDYSKSYVISNKNCEKLLDTMLYKNIRLKEYIELLIDNAAKKKLL